MNIEEFEKKVQPRAKRSRLEPFKAQIFELKKKGYANWQINEWLAANDLKVSEEAVRKFIKSREGKADSIPTSAVVNKKPSDRLPITNSNSILKEAVVSPTLQSSATRKITTPTDIRNARKREINLDDYTDKEGEE